MAIVSYAQNFEDVLLNRVFGGRDFGFYIDIGAYDPVDGSVTKAFYDRGWSGINIEPGDVFDKLAAARPRDINLREAVLDRTGEIQFFQNASDAGMSQVVESGTDSHLTGDVRTVPCDTLANILTRLGVRRPIDFCKIDAEGAEHAIISGTDWRKIRPTVLVVEATPPWSNQLDNQDWESILLGQGYRRAWFDGINCFYIPEERSDLLRHFELPINVLDGFVRFDPALARLTESEAALGAQLDERRAEQKAIGAELDHLRHECVQLDIDLKAEKSAHTSEAAALRAEVAERERLQPALSIATAEREALATELARLRPVLAAANTERDTLAARNAALSGVEDRRSAVERELLDAERTRETLSRRMESLSEQTAILRRLVRELRWPDGPRALRLVLPLARLLRRGRRTHVPPDPDILAPIAPLMGAPAPPRWRGKRWLAWHLYKPFRPVLRPIAWRTRAFLTGALSSDITELRRVQERMDAMLRDLALRDPAFAQQVALRQVEIVDELRRFGKSLDTTLLTLALERDGLGF